MWLRRLLKNPLLSSAALLKPWACQALEAACGNGQTVVLSMDQIDLGDRFAVLMVSLGVGGGARRDTRSPNSPGKNSRPNQSRPLVL